MAVVGLVKLVLRRVVSEEVLAGAEIPEVREEGELIIQRFTAVTRMTPSIKMDSDDNHHNDSYIKMGSDASHQNDSLR